MKPKQDDKNVSTRRWMLLFDERQRAEIDFACLYAKDFHHGTDGHNAKMIIAKMAELLTEAENG